MQLPTKSPGRIAYDESQERLLTKWADALSRHTGRSVAELLSQGLTVKDFGFKEVTLNFEDDSRLFFRYAFFVRDAKMPEWVCVFTEHCGYYEFYLTDEDSIRCE